jgi:hypothetical protein
MDWVQDHVWWLVAASIVSFIATLLGVRWFLVRIPADYFARPPGERKPFGGRHQALAVLLLVGKNVLGYVFIAAGVLMLLLPGQGVLTILVGLILISFPGKRALEIWLITRVPALRSINWLRRRAGKPPLVFKGK